jgi:hypothetical protein
MGERNIAMTIEACAGMVVGYVVVLVGYRPYEKVFNMVAVIMNEILKFLFLAFMFLIEKNLVPQLWIMIGTYLTLALLLILEAISIFRIKLSWTHPTPSQNQTLDIKKAFKLNQKDN